MLTPTTMKGPVARRSNSGQAGLQVFTGAGRDLRDRPQNRHWLLIHYVSGLLAKASEVHVPARVKVGHNARWQGRRAKRTRYFSGHSDSHVARPASCQGFYSGFESLPPCLGWHFSRQVHDLLCVGRLFLWVGRPQRYPPLAVGHLWQQCTIMSLCGADVSLVDSSEGKDSSRQVCCRHVGQALERCPQLTAGTG